MLLKKLTSEGLRLFAHQEQIDAPFKKWEKTLSKIPVVLEDAEGKQVTEQSVTIWLGELQNLAYDLKDIMDELDTEALQRKLLFKPDQPSTKDCKFEEEELILLRMAQGFLRHENSEKPVEQLGHQYSGELQSRSHFRQSSSNVSRFAMHDFINDLAHKYDGIKRFEAIDGVKHLRTSLPISSRVVWDYSHLNRNVLFDLSLKLQCFRYELPSEIGDLKILRYLNFSDAQVETSPESVCKLHNLETLKLQNCNRLQKLFADIGNLNNLHHLDNFVTFSLESLESLVRYHCVVSFLYPNEIL
ncbi:hypothetical protein KPL70_018989 [Citrus sinensis]|nr:hypothetical protein KPL70_018989 [Citrus sinensis]